MQCTHDFFHQHLKEVDPEIYNFVQQENDRQSEGIELIASENLVSKAVMDACGSGMTNKYAEGYPTKRYYGGCVYMDEVESLAIERAKALFGCVYANVQPHSGASANLAVFLALLQPGDTYLSLALDHGGHLTHGAKPNISGKWFHPVHYGIDEKTGYIDFQQLEDQAEKHRPKVIIAGASAYSRIIDFQKFREVADKVGAYLMVDMAHIAGLVATGHHPSPFPHAHVATSTTQKTLRGARGGIILSQDLELGKEFNSAIFPGIQGGPLMQQITGKAVAFGEALKPTFKNYIHRIIENAQTLASTLTTGGCEIYSGGTDNHLMLLDLRSVGVTGVDAEKSLERAGITCNKNSIPFDSEKPTITSGIRLGTPAVTTRGFGKPEMEIVGKSILAVLSGLRQHGVEGNKTVEVETKEATLALCHRFPIYDGMK